jgi:hypothetical protein
MSKYSAECEAARGSDRGSGNECLAATRDRESSRGAGLLAIHGGSRVMMADLKALGSPGLLSNEPNQRGFL